ncbi:release factor H-coupled R [Auriculariales sp. MPI-PUGE-AT-0066]|nr:release factor H-coupled R [Auriculariales sp. MPI-PUGE-AT-0066]
MSLHPVTIILNSNQTKRFAVTLSTTDNMASVEILRQARNKFRIRALSHLYLFGGLGFYARECIPHDADRIWVGKGEPYAGPPLPVQSDADLASTSNSTPPSETLVLAQEAYVDSDAVKQLNAVASLRGVSRAVGMPDLHPGSRFPIGCAVIANCVYPALVGSDIGCGVSIYYIASRWKRSPARLAARLIGLEGRWSGDLAAWLQKYELDPEMPVDDLGTVGGGNHFAELCEVEDVFDAAAHVKLTPGALLLMVHSGSRGLGASILQRQTTTNANPRLDPGSEACDAYLSQHDAAVRWGRANRDLIAHRIAHCLLGSDPEEDEEMHALEKIADVSHNAVEAVINEQHETVWIHRKGAAPSRGHVGSGIVPCPGSRGTFSYLLRGVGDGSRNAHSLAHGAGRRHPRSHMHDGASAATLTTTALGSTVVCDDRTLLLEERPEAYKDVECVVRDMERDGCAVKIAKLRPVVSYKVRSE